MTGQFIVVHIEESKTKPIEGADRIVRADIMGETLIVSKEEVGKQGLMFDTETALNKDLASTLNLFRDKSLNVEDKTGYLEDKARIKPIKLRGVKVSGLFLSFDRLEEVFELRGISELRLGVQGNVYKGYEVCKKYVPKRTTRVAGGPRNSGNQAKESLVPDFKRHVDTDHYHRVVGSIHGEFRDVVITEKLHGTSGRCGFVKTPKQLSKASKFFHWLLGADLPFAYEFVSGSRRVVKSIGERKVSTNGYYKTDIHMEAAEFFRGKLNKGETVYYEIVGYEKDGGLIMGSGDNKKLKSFLPKDEYKEFINKYGETTKFDYGCEEGKHDIYVYRISNVTESGDIIDLTWDQLKVRCETLAVKHVPEIARYTVNFADSISVEHLSNSVDVFTLAESEDFPNIIREGVIVRVDTGKGVPKLMKNKSFTFKVLEGIIKEKTNDIEDAS